MSSTNTACKNWLNNELVKHGSAWSSAFNNAKSIALKHLLRSPTYISKSVKTGLGVGVGSAIAETGLRTANNWAHGNPSMGDPTTTGYLLGKVLNIAGTGSGLSPLVSQTVKSMTDGIDMSPRAQEILSAAANVTNPAVRRALSSDASSTLANAADAASSNIGGTFGNYMGRGLSEGLVSGLWDNLKKHPIPTISGAVAVSAGPLIGYDLITRKRRLAEAERNKAILRYILKHENNGDMQKTGNWSDVIKSISKKLYAPNPIIYQLGKHPQTLLNNSVTRNPVKSLLGASLVGGTAESIAESQSDKGVHNYGDNLSIYGHWARNMLGMPASLIKDVEGSVWKGNNINNGKSPTMMKINEILTNFTNPKKDYALSPYNSNYVPPHFNLSSGQKDKIQNLDWNGVTGTPRVHPNGIAPYLATAGLFALPPASYATYKHFANKKLNKAVELESKRQDQLEHINNLIET